MSSREEKSFGVGLRQDGMGEKLERVMDILLEEC
jgi:hypothetical protein